MVPKTSVEKLLKRRSQRTSLGILDPTLKPIADPVDTYAQPAVAFPIDQREAAGRWVGEMSRFNTGLASLAEKVNKEMEYERAIGTGDAISQAVSSYYAQGQDGKVQTLTENTLPGEAVANSQEGLTPPESAAVREAVDEEATARLGYPEQRRKGIEFLKERGLDVTMFPRQMRLFDQLLARKYAVSAHNYVAENWAALIDPYSKKTVRDLMAESVGAALGDPDLTFDEILSLHPTMAAELTAVAEKTEDAAKRGKSGAKLKQMEEEITANALDYFNNGLNASLIGDSTKSQAEYMYGFLTIYATVDAEGNAITLPGGGAALRFKLYETAKKQLESHAAIAGNFVDGEAIRQAGINLADGLNLALGRGKPVPEAKTTIGPEAKNQEAPLMEDGVVTIDRLLANLHSDTYEEAQGRKSKPHEREPEVGETWPALDRLATDYDRMRLPEFMKLLPNWLGHNMTTALVDWDGDETTPPTTLEDHFENQLDGDLLTRDIDISAQQGLFDRFKKYMIETKGIPTKVYERVQKNANTEHWMSTLDGQIKFAINGAIRELQKAARGELAAKAQVVRDENFLETQAEIGEQEAWRRRVEREKWDKDAEEAKAAIARAALAEEVPVAVREAISWVAGLEWETTGNPEKALRLWRNEDGKTLQELLDTAGADGNHLIPPGTIRDRLQNLIDMPTRTLSDIQKVAESVHGAGELTHEAQGSRDRGTLKGAGQAPETGIGNMVPGAFSKRRPVHPSFQLYGSSAYRLQAEFQRELTGISEGMRNNKELAKELFLATSDSERTEVIAKYTEIGLKQRDDLLNRIHKKGADLKRD